MNQRQSLYTAAVLVLGRLIGWLAGSGRMDGALNAAASPTVQDPVGRSRRNTGAGPSTLLATTAVPASGSAPTQDVVEKPNILVIMADDILLMNIYLCNGDIMDVKTPDIDRIGNEGVRFTSFYAQPSCTAGRAAFLTGQLPVRTGLTTVGTPGSPAGLQKQDVTLAEILKSRGYSTAQFGKNQIGDREEHPPHLAPPRTRVR